MWQRNGIWAYDIVIEGKRFAGSTGERDKSKAEAWLEKFKAEKLVHRDAYIAYEEAKRNLAKANTIRLELDTVWKSFRESGNTAGERRLGIYRNHLKSFVEYMAKEFPTIDKVDMVIGLHAIKWVAHLRGKSISASTVNSYVTSLRCIFNALGKNYGIIENPFDEVKKLAEDPIEREAFSPEELKLIGEHATGWIYQLCVTAVSTGLREGDICNLRVADVDLDSGWLTIRTHKTKAKVEIPILPGLRSVLADAMLESDGEYVFPFLHDKYENNSPWIGRNIKAFFESIGITGTKVQGAAKKVSVKDVHSFRHTFCYLAAVNGIPLPIVQSIVGHANSKMTRHYMDHATRQEKSRFFKMIPEYIAIDAPEPIPPKDRLGDLVEQLNQLSDTDLAVVRAMVASLTDASARRLVPQIEAV